MKTQMEAQTSAGAPVRAEVSGWDRAGGYFVERTDVQMQGSRMVICLRRAMAPHSILFVRMLLADGSLERESRLMQVARCRKDRSCGYCVDCRAAQQRRTRVN